MKGNFLEKFIFLKKELEKENFKLFTLGQKYYFKIGLDITGTFSFEKIVKKYKLKPNFPKRNKFETLKFILNHSVLDYKIKKEKKNYILTFNDDDSKPMSFKQLYLFLEGEFISGYTN